MPIDFGENNDEFSNLSNRSSSGSKMTEWLVDKGIAKDEKTASVILVSFIIIIIVVSLFIFNSGRDKEITIDGNTLEELLSESVSKAQ